MTVFNPSFESLDFWQRLLVTYTCLLGAEGPFLLFVAVTRRRAWWECALALAPTAGFAWGLWTMRGERGAVAAWQSYIAFQETYYPARYWPAFAWEEPESLRALLSAMQEQAVELGALTLALLILGWVLLLRWRFDLKLASRTVVNPAQAAPESQEPLDLVIEPIEATGAIEPIEAAEREAP